jgi:hypothetical protein
MAICVIGTANVSNCIVCTTTLTYMPCRVIRTAASPADMAISMVGTSHMTDRII